MRSSFAVLISLAVAASSVSAQHHGFGGGNHNQGGNNGQATTSASSSAAASSVSTSAAAVASVAPPASGVGQNGAASTGATQNNANAQNSLTLLTSLVQTGSNQNGQEVQEAGQVASATSPNNFLNFCATHPNLPLTNGLQVKTGSCNGIPMGVILANTQIPVSKFVFPKNNAVIPANENFTVVMAINNLATGFFTSAASTYYAAPATVNAQGLLVGHSHVNIQLINGLDDTNPIDVNSFAFFKGFNVAAVNGQLTALVAGGLPAGTYKMCSINAAANHQPALASIAQHASIDDCSYFTAAGGAAPPPATTTTLAAAQATTSSSPPVTTSSVAPPSVTTAAGGNSGKSTGNNNGGGKKRCNAARLAKRRLALEN